MPGIRARERRHWTPPTCHHSGAGCRSYSLTLDGAGSSWVEVTGDQYVVSTSMLGPPGETATYTLPEVAEAGAYVLCAHERSTTLCGEFVI